MSEHLNISILNLKEKSAFIDDLKLVFPGIIIREIQTNQAKHNLEGLYISDDLKQFEGIKSAITKVFICINKNERIQAIKNGIQFIISDFCDFEERKAILELAQNQHYYIRSLRLELNQIKRNLLKGEIISKYGHYHINLETNQVNFSKGAIQIYGIDKSEFSLHEMHSHHKDDSIGKIKHSISELISNKTPLEFNYKIIRQTDQKIIHLHSISQIDEDGKNIFGVIKDITEYVETKEELLEVQNNLKRSEKIARLGSYEWDFERQIWINNPILNQIFGVEESTLKTYKNWIQLIHPDYRKMIKGHIRSLASAKITKIDLEFKGIRQTDSKTIWVHGLGEIKLSNEGKVLKLYGTARDISQEKEILEEHIKLTKIYNLISELNNILLRTTSIQTLLQTICKLIVDYGHYSLCWIGEKYENINAVKPIAHEGYEGGFLKLLEEFKMGLGSSERALLEEKTIVCNDINNCGCSKIWRKEALSREFKSSISLPIRLYGKLGYIISLYSNEKNSFSSAAEIELLEIIMKNISFVLEGMKNEEEKTNIKSALLESESKFSKTFYLNPSAAGLSSIETGKYIEVNESFTNLLGYSTEEVIGKTALDLGILSSEMRNEILSKVGKNGSLKNAEGIIFAKGGIKKHVLLSAENLILDTKQYRYTVVQDITERKKSEEETKQNDLRIQSILRISQFNTDSIKDLLDFSLRELVSVSQSKVGFIYLFNETNQELKFLSKFDTDDSINSFEPNIKSIQLKNTEFWAQAIKNKSAFVYNENFHHQEFPVKVNTIERYLSIPVFREDKIVALLSVANKNSDYQNFDTQQLTIMMDAIWNYVDLKQADLKIKQLFKAVEQSPVSVVITDVTGNIEYVNPAFQNVTGYKTKEVLGQNPRVLKSGNTSTQEYQNMWNTICSGKIWKGEFQNKKKNGELFWESAVLSPIMNEKGDIINFLAVKSDITQQKNAEKHREKITSDLVAQNYALSQFTYIISHNLRAPVANLIGLSHLIIDENISPNEYKKVIENICESVEKIDTVIIDLNQILQVKEIITEHKENILFIDILNHVKQDLHKEIIESRAAIIGDFSRANHILSIRSYLISIFNNLISNSIKYRNKKDQTIIEISSHICNDGIEIKFKDNGLGINLGKHKDNIFGLYKRFHHQIAEGRGVGLFMVKTRVEALHGTIKIDSEEMKGTTISICFENN